MNPAFQAGLGSFNVPSVAGTAGPGSAASRGASQPLVVNMNMNGTRFAQVIVPDLIPYLRQQGRTQNMDF